MSLIDQWKYIFKRYTYIPYKSSVFIFTICIFVIPNKAYTIVNIPQLVKNLQPAIITVVTYDKNKKVLKQGSGFFIDKNGYIISNNHVFDDSYSAEIIFHNGKKYPVEKVCAVNPKIDLIKVLVNIKSEEIVWLNIKDDEPNVAESILVIGSPEGLESTVSDGIVSSIRKIPEIGTVIQLTAPISSGSSGSPVIDMEGNVIGIASFRLIKGQNLNFAISTTELLNLKEYKNCKSFEDWNVDKLNERLRIADELYDSGAKLIDTANNLYISGVESKDIKEFDEGIKLLKETINLNKDHELAWQRLGDAYSNQFKFSESISAYKKCLKINPKNENANERIFWAYISTRQYEEALSIAKMALENDSKNPHYWGNLSLAYRDLGQMNMAITTAKTMVKINPEFPKSHYVLGLMYYDNGDIDSALQEYKVLKDLDPKLAETLLNFIYK